MRRTGLVLLVLVAARPSLAQTQDPKQLFAAALGGVTAALEGRFGDDANRVQQGLASLEASLSSWDQAIRSLEASIAIELANATPQAATRLHVALALALAERGRIDEALAQLGRANDRTPRDVDAHTVLGLVQSQLMSNAAAAVSAFRNAVAGDPNAPLQRYLLVKQLADQGAIEEAAAVGQPLRADTRNPDAPDRSPFLRIHLIPERPGVEPYFPPVRYVEALALMSRSRYDAGLAALRLAAATDPLLSAPDAARADLQHAGVALRNGDTAAALTALDRARPVAPTWGEWHRLRGVALVADERMDEAIAAFKEALRLGPLDERAHLALADSYSQQQRYDDADAALQSAIAALPTSPKLHHARALVLQRQGLYPEALAEFDKALSLEPSLPLLGKNSVYETVATLRRARQEFTAATVAFARRVDLVPNDVKAHRDLGDIYFRQGLDDLAWTEFAIAEALAPRDVATQAALAQLHLRAGRNRDAVTVARRIIQLSPTDVQAHFVLGTALIRLDQTDEGTRALDTFARLEAADAEARSRQLALAALRREAEVATGEGNHTRAVTLLEQIVEQEPTSAGAHVALGVALITAGRAAEAVDQLQAAAGLGAEGVVYRHLADAYAQIGAADQSARAREVYARIRRERLRETQQP
jgi:tetratricopeptide (TPR) repeat protein